MDLKELQKPAYELKLNHHISQVSNRYSLLHHLEISAFPVPIAIAHRIFTMTSPSPFWENIFLAVRAASRLFGASSTG